jgi:hypothetical protein
MILLTRKIPTEWWFAWIAIPRSPRVDSWPHDYDGIGIPHRTYGAAMPGCHRITRLTPLEPGAKP